MLIASSTDAFLSRFEFAFADVALRIFKASDGYEALTLLERGHYDLLLLDGGTSGVDSGLEGISSDELSHMWRQIEGRASRLIIGYVSQRGPDDVENAPSRFGYDPVLVAKNRGADHHFWSEQTDAEIVDALLNEVNKRRQQAAQAISLAMSDKVVPISQIGSVGPDVER